MIKFHYIGKKILITTNKKIKENDLYIDSLVHPNLIKYPLVMYGYCNKEKNIIQSHSGTTSPISTSRRIFLIIG
jgi:hypothetical protein